MPDFRLMDYITRCLRAGQTPQQIRQSLLNSGWPHQQVDEAFSYVLSQQGPTPAQPQTQPQGYASQQQAQAQKPLGLLQKFKMVLAHPNQFFERVKPEEGYESPVKFYLFVMFIHIIALNVIFLTYFSLLSSMSGLGSEIGITAILVIIFSSILSANLSVLLSILGTFIGAALIHVIAVIFGAKRGYQNTYKALIYSTAPSILIWPVLGLLLVNFWAAIGGAALIYIWSFILEVKGLSRLHEISGARAFAILFVPILIVLVLVGFVLLFALGIFNPTTYTGRIPTGFTGLGAPSDWDLDSEGDFSIILNNKQASNVEINKVEITLDSATDSYEPSTPVNIGPGGEYELSSSESGLNLGPQVAGTAYSIEVEITYKKDIFTHAEYGRVTGAVSK